MVEQFVTYEIAKQLKDLGYNPPLGFGIYDKDNNTLQYTNPAITFIGWHTHLQAPLWQQVIDWFREEKRIYINIEYNNITEDYNFTIYDGNFPQNYIERIMFNSSEQAREQAILKAIDLCKKH